MVKRCLIITYYFPPVGGGGVQRITKLIKYLGRSGWKFTVLTASELNSHQPNDSTFDSELAADVRVERISYALPGGRQRAIIKIPNFMERWISAFLYIPDSRKSWLPKVKQAVIEELENNRYDCILISVPPYSLAVLAADLTKEADIPVFLDMRDPWSANPYKIYPTFFQLKKDRLLEFETIKNIRNGISAYSSLIDYWKTSIPGFRADNWHVIPNGYDEEDFKYLPVFSKKDTFFNIAFSGTFYSHINHPKFLFRAFARLKKRNSSAGSLIRFHHFGKSMIDLEKLSRRYGLENQVYAHGYLDHRSVLEKLNSMDALCFILDDSHEHSGKTIGGKVYEYLRLKKPILALTPKSGEAAKLIEECQAGAVVPASETGKIAGILGEWIKNPPSFAFAGIEKYNRENQAAIFNAVFEKALNNEG